MAPDGDAWAPAKPRPYDMPIRALARAHRWSDAAARESGAVAVQLTAEPRNESVKLRQLRDAARTEEIDGGQNRGEVKL